MSKTLPATLCILLALPAAASASAMEPAAPPGGDPDTREVITMDPGGRHLVLGEMRQFLEGIQQITVALSRDDLEAAASAARSLGLEMAGTVPPQVMRQLPPEFRQLGRSTHADFDQIALDLETLGDTQYALRQLGDTINKCVSCHATWRIEVEAPGRGLHPEE